MKHGNGSYSDLFSFALVSLIMSIGALAFAARNMALSKKEVEKINVFNPGKPIPTSFWVESKFVSPSGDRKDRDTSLYFQITDYFESFYKKKALEKKTLSNTEHLKFSTQHVIEEIEKSKQKITNFEDFISFLKSQKSKQSIFVPETCCEYSQKDNEKCSYASKCPNIFDFSFSNDPKALFATTNIRDVKQKLVESEMPLTITFSRLKERYFAICNESNVFSSTETCRREDIQCTNTPGKHCTPLDFDINGEFFNDIAFRRGGRTIVGENVSALVVGYHDSFVPKSIVNITNKETPRGGFIVKTSLGRRGHSFEYLTGEISEDQENLLCPNIGDPMHWIPGSIQCMKASSGNLSQCGFAEIRRGNKTYRSTDELECINEKYCSKDSKYALVGSTVPLITFSSEGIPQATIAKIKEGTITADVFVELPFQYLSKAFALKDSSAKNSDKCGFAMLPYEALNDIQRSGTGSWIAHAIEVTFDDKSYEKIGSKYDSSHITRSTLKSAKLNIANLLDYL